MDFPGILTRPALCAGTHRFSKPLIDFQEKSVENKARMAVDPLIGGNVGSYNITSKIGVGGMGAVYMGVHPLIGKKVAVKVLHAEFADKQDVVHRFFQE